MYISETYPIISWYVLTDLKENWEFSTMPYICASNIKNAFVIGIILIFLNALDIMYYFIIQDIFKLITGFLGLVSASILTYGAHTRNSKAMLIYNGSAILIIILLILGIVKDFSGDDDLSKFWKEACKALLKMFFLIIVKI